MIQDRSFITVSLVFAILLTAGCLSQPTGEIQKENISSSVIPPTNSPNYTHIRTHSNCTYPDNTTLWIRIDPIGHIYRGDVIPITGTSNLCPGEEILVSIAQTIPFGGIKEEPIYWAVNKSVPVMSGFNGINVWSVDINTSTFKPAYYTESFLGVSAIDQNATADVLLDISERRSSPG